MASCFGSTIRDGSRAEHALLLTILYVFLNVTLAANFVTSMPASNVEFNFFFLLISLGPRLEVIRLFSKSRIRAIFVPYQRVSLCD